MPRVPQWAATGVLWLIVLVLHAACATGLPRGSLLAEAGEEQEGEAADERVRLSLPTCFGAVRVSDFELDEALTTLVLNMPLRVAGAHVPLYLHRKLALASVPLTGEEWRTPLARSYGGFCERRGTPGDCLGLFEDGPGLDGEDKRDLALALSVNAALESRDAQLRGMFSTAQLWTTLSLTLIGYLALVAAPEPVSKGVAAALALLMWGYLGWELFDLVRAYFQLWEEAAEASTFAELREAGERFGKVIGPNSVRVLLLLGTAAVGGDGGTRIQRPNAAGLRQSRQCAQIPCRHPRRAHGRAGSGQGEGRRGRGHLQCHPARQRREHDRERALEIRACPAATNGGPTCRDSVQRREERTTCRRLHSVGERQIRHSGSERSRTHLRAERYARYDCSWAQRGRAQE